MSSDWAVMTPEISKPRYIEDAIDARSVRRVQARRVTNNTNRATPYGSSPPSARQHDEQVSP